MKKHILILLIVFIIPNYIFANNKTDFSKNEKLINEQIKIISQIRFNETLADSLSNKLLNYFIKILEKKESLSYPFDSLKGIGKVESSNKKLRIFTWNIVKNNGTYNYYGILQHYNKNKKQSEVFVLTDSSENMQNVESLTLSDKKWYGALYYEIVENKMPDKSTLYTLIGWDGNTLYTSKKIIETLYFTKTGKPKFGKNVFQLNRKKQKRVIFEFSRMANMMIGYKNKMKMIVFDHLSPSEQKYEGNPAFYGPDYSFDGFQFKHGVWNLYSDVPYQVLPK